MVVPDSEAAQARTKPGAPDPRVKDYVEARLSPTADLWVRQARLTAFVTITTEVVPKRLEAAAEVETAMSRRLARFLHPLTGGTTAPGWPFGRAPYRSDLLALVESIPIVVDHVRVARGERDHRRAQPGAGGHPRRSSGVHDVKAVADQPGGDQSMTLQPPVLDNRSYNDLLQEAGRSSGPTRLSGRTATRRIRGSRSSSSSPGSPRC